MNVQVAIAAGDQNRPSSQRIFVSVASARPSRRILFSSSSETRHHPRLLIKFSVHGWFNTIGQILFSCLALNTSLRKRNCWIHAEVQQLLFAAEAVGEPPQLCAAWFDQKKKATRIRKPGRFLFRLGVANSGIRGWHDVSFVNLLVSVRSRKTRYQQKYQQIVRLPTLMPEQT